MPARRLSTALLAVTLLAAACGSNQDTSGSSAVAPQSGEEPPVGEAAASEEEGATTTVTTVQSTPSMVAEPPVETTTTTAPIPEPLAAQIEGLIATVESIRELEFVAPPTVLVMSPEEVTERRAASLREDLADADLLPESALYDLLGIFDGRVDLEDFYTEFYSASTLAYYDLDEHELIVPLTGELLTPYEQWIFVHELTHALLDQQYPDVTANYVELGEGDRFDEAGGLLGLIEGEAVLIQSLFYETLDSSERVALQEQANARRNSTFAAAPAFFRDIARFPYTDGSLFSLYLYQRGGMEAIDRAYAGPPETTEHIYDPERYVEGEGSLDVDLLVAPPFGFTVAERGVWGARGWRALFGQSLNGATAAEAADGWGGDEYVLLWNPETHQVAFAALFVGDTERDAAEFGGAVQQLIEATMDVELRFDGRRSSEYRGGDYASVVRVGDQILFVAASDQVAGNAVRAAVRGFGP